MNVLKGRKIAVFAEAPALRIRVTHCFAMVARIGRRKRGSLVEGSKVFTSGGVKSFDFSKRGHKGVVTGEIELVAGFTARESRLGRGQRALAW